MRKLMTTLAAVSAILCAGLLADRADAMTVGNPAGIRAALNDVAVTDQVHCRWGWLHHSWWNGRPHWDGCYRGNAVIVGPRFFVGPRFRSGRVFHFHGGGRHFHGGGHHGGGHHGGHRH